MHTLNRFLVRNFVRALMLLMATCAFGQLGVPARQGQTASAIQLPLSGRTGQNGSVTTTELPVPGTTTSVNTLNPGVQVQGPYAGSAKGKEQFSGKLSLREAVERGLRYNLGRPDAVRQAHRAEGRLCFNLSGSLRSSNNELYGKRLALVFLSLRFSISVGPVQLL
jgi:hypothetical protein